MKKQMPQKSISKQITATVVVEYANEAIKEIIGQGAAKFAQAIYFKEKIIAITCLSSVVAQEIKINEKQLIAKINTKFGSQTVEKIRYLA